MHSRLKMMADRVVSLHSTASSFSHVALLLPSNHGDCMQTWSVVVLIALSRGWWGNCYNPSHLYIQNDYLFTYVLHWFEAIFFLNWAYFYVSKYKHESIKAIWNIIRYVMLVHIPMPSSYLPVMQLKFQSCFEIKSRRIIMCVRQVFCQWFIIFYGSECPSWFVIIYSFM